MKKISVLALLVLSACGSNSSDSVNNSTQRETENQKIMRTLSYEFTDQLDSGKTCSTGQRVVRNHHELCMRIQDNDFNQQCATGKRIDFFIENCKGYQFLSGLNCRFGVLKPDAKANTNSQLPTKLIYDKDQFLQTQDVCVGRDLGPKDENQIGFTVYSNYYNNDLSLFVSFDSNHDSSRFDFKMKSSKTSEPIEEHYKAGNDGMTFGSVTGPLLGEKESFLIYAGCEVVAGCERSK